MTPIPVRRTLTLPGKPRPKSEPKPKRWNHQDELAALRGKMVYFTIMEFGSFRAELLEADQFTVKVRCVEKIDAELPRELTFSKHAIIVYAAAPGA